MRIAAIRFGLVFGLASVHMTAGFGGQPIFPTCVPRCTSLADLLVPEDRNRISDLAHHVRERLVGGTTAASVDILNDHFFNTFGFRVEKDLMSAEGLLPAAVLDRRSGYCVGLAIVYLFLANELGLPIWPVAAPNHAFLRFDDGHTRRNIELLDQGVALDDNWYITRYRISRRAMSAGVFLAPMSEQEFLAYVYVNMGAVHSRTGEHRNARLLYEAALSLNSLLPSAHYNLGLDLARQGDVEAALRRFQRALELNPTDPWTLYARGMAFCTLGKTRRAARELRKAIAVDGEFQVAKEKLATLSCTKSHLRRHR